MFKYLLPLFLTSLLSADGIHLKKDVAPLNDTFLVEADKDTFDNTISYTHKALLDCSPQLDVVYKVVSDSQLLLIPKHPLPASTNYSCSHKSQKFTFMTEALQLLDSVYFPKEKMFRLSFNTDIDPQSVSKGIKLTKLDKLSKTNLKYTLSQQGEQTLVLQINEPVGTKSIKLTIDKALKTNEGKSFAKSFSKTFNQYNHKIELDPEKKSLDLSDKPQMVALDNGEFALRIFLNDNLTGESKRAIAIEGVEEFQVSDYHYLSRSMRRQYGLDDSYYYHDVTSSDFKPNTEYEVTLKEGLSSYYREIKSDIHYTLKTPDRAKAIIFDQKKPYISSEGELSFSSVNIEKATLVVERLLDDNLRYFMNFSHAHQASAPSYSKEIFSKDVILNKEKNRLLKQKFKLSDLNKGDLPVGVYRVSLHFTEANDEEETERISSKVLFLSNLGISANIAKEQAFVTVLSLDKAQPVEGATVKIYGANNALLGTATTDDDGVAIINNAKLLKGKPKGVVVQTSDDKNFLALNESISSPSASSLLQKQERFKAHIYFQSNILRPASTIHALVTVKDRDFLSASELPLKLVLKDPNGKEKHKRVYHTDEYGLIDFSYQLDNSDKTGNYLLYAYMGDKMIGSKKLKVEAFMPPKIENSISSNKELYNIDELMEVNISSSYLFGAPSSNLQGKVTLNARPISYVNKAFENYHFSNDILAKENVTSYLDHSEDIVLDENGKFQMVLKNHLSQQVPSMLEAMIGVTIMDDAQPVSNYKKVKIYPYKAMVGLKINGDSFERGQKLEGKAILIDPLTGKAIQRKLYGVIKKTSWHYDYYSGNYHWEKETKVVDTFTLNANEEFSRTLLSNGDHSIEIYDRIGGHSASSSFDVWWWNYSNVSPSHDLKSVEIKFEDKLYRKGDKIEVQIKSPILEGQLLLTLENAKVQNHKLVEIHKGVAKTSIEITNEMHRGLYLHATAFRASDTPSKLIPFRAMGYKFVKPNRNKHKIKLTMSLPKVTKSKVPLSFKIESDKDAKILVSIVDRGILQLVDQKSPKIFDYFNEKQPKELSYYDLYDQLLAYIAEGKLVDFGAGDMLSKKKKHLAPDLGKRIKPFMIWSGIVEAHNGVAEIKIDIPEFNGRASVVAIAMNNDSIGVAQQEIVVKDDVMIKPSYPRYGLVGDKIEVPLRLFNTTNTPKEIHLEVNASTNLSFELNATTLTLPANSSKRLVAYLAPKAEGKGSITLTATYNKQVVTNHLELPLLSPYSLSTKTFKGIANTPQSIDVPKEYQGAKSYITLSTNLIGALRDELRYLVQYPYGCAEQTSSKLSAMHFSKAFLRDDKLFNRSEHFILQGVKKLDGMQNYYGEFNYWEGGSYVHAYASLYAAQALLDIEEGGGPVKADFKKRIVKMLKNVASANSKYNGSYTNFHRLFAGYILAEHKLLSKSIANMLYEKEIYKGHFLSTFYMAAILKTQGEEAKAKKLFDENSYELSRYAYKTYGNRTGNFESNVRDMMLHFIIKTKYFNKSASDLVAIQKEFPNLYSTQTKAVALKAISTFLGKPKNAKLDVTVKVNNEEANYRKPTLIALDKVSSKSIKLDPNHNAMSYSVELVKNIEKPLYNKIDSNKELSIKREFIDENGDEINLETLKQGDKLFSKVTIVNYGKINHVVVNQRVPACFEIVNNNIKEKEARFKDENINQEHKEIRDDRILHFLNLRKQDKWSRSLDKRIVIENRGVFYSPLIATSIGECKLPALIAEAMYDTRINAYAKGAKRVVVSALNSSNKSVTPIKRQSKALEKRAKELVEEIYKKEMNSNDALAFSQFFEFPLSTYFRTKNVSKDALLADKKKYFKEWAIRNYSNLKTTIVSKHNNEVKVQITFDYKLFNGKKVLNGQSKHILTLVEENKKLMVTAIEL